MEDLSNLSVKELRSRLQCARIDFSQCVEKSELVALLQQHLDENESTTRVTVADATPPRAASDNARSRNRPRERRGGDAEEEVHLVQC